MQQLSCGGAVVESPVDCSSAPVNPSSACSGTDTARRQNVATPEYPVLPRVHAKKASLTGTTDTAWHPIGWRLELPAAAFQIAAGAGKAL